MKYLLFLLTFTFMLSCAYKITQQKYVFYDQRALLCVEKTPEGHAIFESPSGMSKFITTNKKEAAKCNVGDTLLVKFHKTVMKKGTETLIYSLKPYHK